MARRWMADFLRAFDDALDLDWEHERSDTAELASRFGLGGPVPSWPVEPRLAQSPIG